MPLTYGVSNRAEPESYGISAFALPASLFINTVTEVQRGREPTQGAPSWSGGGNTFKSISVT